MQIIAVQDSEYPDYYRIVLSDMTQKYKCLMAKAECRKCLDEYCSELEVGRTHVRDFAAELCVVNLFAWGIDFQLDEQHELKAELIVLQFQVLENYGVSPVDGARQPLVDLFAWPSCEDAQIRQAMLRLRKKQIRNRLQRDVRELVAHRKATMLSYFYQPEDDCPVLNKPLFEGLAYVWGGAQSLDAGQ